MTDDGMFIFMVVLLVTTGAMFVGVITFDIIQYRKRNKWKKRNRQ